MLAAPFVAAVAGLVLLPATDAAAQMSAGAAGTISTGAVAHGDPYPAAVTPVAAARTNARCTWLGDTRCDYPRLVLSIDGGLSHFTSGGPQKLDEGLGKQTQSGGAWGARVGVQASSWLAFDVHYIGLYNRTADAISPAGDLGLLTNAVALEARLTIPFPYVQPYVLGGLGVYATSIAGSAAARSGALVHGTTNPGIPLGVGLGSPVSRRLSVAVEVVYHRYRHESFSSNGAISGGDPTTAVGVLRMRL